MAGLPVRFLRHGLGQGLQRAAAAGPDLGGAGRQPGEEVLHPLLHRRLGPEAGVGRHLLADLDTDSEEEREAGVERLVSLDARRVDWPRADVVVLADTEGNLFCVI